MVHVRDVYQNLAYMIFRLEFIDNLPQEKYVAKMRSSINILFTQVYDQIDKWSGL